MPLEPNEIHIWQADLNLTVEQEHGRMEWLSPDERERARRFHLPLHQQRFIAAHSMLRDILSRYLQTDKTVIAFTTGEHKKPAIDTPHTALQFNLSHSHNMAVFAITLNHAIGVDIERCLSHFNADLAKRFFHPNEYAGLMAQAEADRAKLFYHLWARKEALIKATGKGLSIPLKSFAVSLTEVDETLPLENDNWSLKTLSMNPDYQTAVASNQIIKKLTLWDYWEQIARND